ncbi:aldose epimerase family protein [Flavobacterium sp. NG2]|uniref:aldose epimerase family protein n=1 Tax=Flavobacterium sp. NG2 TaxID=3097547 RepID=UPI002A807426|nr:aldose epimerase family protein [Flavobacterium sp. NG2]WPR70090.1 aldose epimerase family protein [Flavobacterium sp. NG2]
MKTNILEDTIENNGNPTLRIVTIKNENGMTLQLTNYGATIMSLKVPNKQGTLTEVNVGLESVEDYLGVIYKENPLYLGSSIGRYAGRISKGSFFVNNDQYQIYHDDGVHLHGGKSGFDDKLWEISKITETTVEMRYLSPHLEEGYPGNLAVKVIFELTENNALKITYTAKTDSACPVNLTSHPYFNLNGKGTVLQHDLKINSSAYLEVSSQLLPSGKILNSEHTNFDRREFSKLGREDFIGFDDTFVLDAAPIKAILFSAETGIELNVYSNQKGMVVFTPKYFPDLPFAIDFSNIAFPAICFEPQNFPDAPHYSDFPNSILEPGEKYSNEIIYAFSIR